MPFYTFIMEYKGGIYVSQIEADSNKTALIKWAKQLEVSEIYGFELNNKEELISEMRDEQPVLLDGLTNVWCVSALISDESALIHFVQTDKATNNQQLSANN
jgi:hypothetical protein